MEELIATIRALGDSPGKCDDCWRKCCPTGTVELHDWRMAWFEVQRQRATKDQPKPEPAKETAKKPAKQAEK